MEALRTSCPDLVRDLNERGLSDLPDDFWTAVLEVFHNAVTTPAPDNIRMLIQNYDSNGLMLHLVRAHQGGAEILHTVSGSSISFSPTESPEKDMQSEHENQKPQG
ncbi:unnamed protein product [Symbiodinium sp. CCMP2592]|nr:unnamed protein product [Symbiodinium sp. CCMP2592]